MKIRELIKQKALYKTQNPPVTIGFLGDSVTQGCFSLYQTSETSLETVYDYKNSYPELLHEKLASVFPSVPFVIVNAGLSGDTAPGGYARIDRDLLVHRPDLVVVCYGLNDVTHGEGGIAAYVNSLKNIFRRLNEEKIETVFMTPNMICTYVSYDLSVPMFRGIAENVSKLQNGGVLDKYIAEAKKAAEEYGIPVCDVYAKWKKLSESGADVTRLLSNRINHPTPEMNRLFADSLFDMMLNL